MSQLLASASVRRCSHFRGVSGLESEPAMIMDTKRRG